MIFLILSPMGLLLCFWIVPRIRDEGLGVWPWIIGLLLFWPLMMLLAAWRLDDSRFYSIGAIGIIVFIFSLLTLSGHSFFSIG
ncbi:MAG: hypothetical protein AAFP02_25050 [Bacteroidota bacterium]